jgi:hypothetical protein
MRIVKKSFIYSRAIQASITFMACSRQGRHGRSSQGYLRHVHGPILGCAGMAGGECVLRDEDEDSYSRREININMLYHLVTCRPTPVIIAEKNSGYANFKAEKALFDDGPTNANFYQGYSGLTGLDAGFTMGLKCFE